MISALMPAVEDEPGVAAAWIKVRFFMWRLSKRTDANPHEPDIRLQPDYFPLNLERSDLNVVQAAAPVTLIVRSNYMAKRSNANTTNNIIGRGGETHQRGGGLTTNFGVPISDNQNTLARGGTVGARVS